MAVLVTALDLAVVTLVALATIATIALVSALIRVEDGGRAVWTSQWTHHRTAEIVWTLAPVGVLACSISPGMAALLPGVSEGCTSSLSVTAHQWYWSTAQGEGAEVRISSGIPRLGSTAQPVYLAQAEGTRVTLGSSDVIHALWLPALGVKVDACPGRLSVTGITPEVEGTYVGYCAELCGSGHGFMPLMVTVYRPCEVACSLVKPVLGVVGSAAYVGYPSWIVTSLPVATTVLLVVILSSAQTSTSASLACIVPWVVVIVGGASSQDHAVSQPVNSSLPVVLVLLIPTELATFLSAAWPTGMSNIDQVLGSGSPSMGITTESALLALLVLLTVTLVIQGAHRLDPQTSHKGGPSSSRQ